MSINKIMTCAGIITLLQSLGQITYTALGLAQYFCVIDFLRGLPILLYLRILYFHNPDFCGSSINIGQTLDYLPNQAFVLLPREPFTTFRTFIVNSISLGLAVLWLISSVIIMQAGAKGRASKLNRWPWIAVTVLICMLDIIATVTYANDLFHTRTLSDVMEYIGGTSSAVGNVQINTWTATWIVMILYSRFVILFIINLVLVIYVVIAYNAEAKQREPIIIRQMEMATNTSGGSNKDLEEASDPGLPLKIPRPGLSQSFRAMKDFLFKKSKPLIESTQTSPDSSPERNRKTTRVEYDKKRTVNFQKSLLSQRLENMIAEQRKRLDETVIDTSGRQSPPRASQSMPQLADGSQQTDFPRGRRGTAAELQGQLPWAYIPSSVHPMRQQLPPDEDLPPVPLPDYSAIPAAVYRKTSVHRAASSLSSMTQKREYFQQQPKSPLTQTDVLY